MAQSRQEQTRAQDRAWHDAMAREGGVSLAPPMPEPAAEAEVHQLPARSAALPPLRDGQVHVGEAQGGGPVGLDLARLIDGRLLIQGNSGAGKSMLLRRLFEQAFGRIQQVLIDPDGEFSTLAEAFDVTVVPADEVLRIGGAALALHIREHRYSAVLDLSDASAEDRLAAAADFAEGLISAPAAHWHPLLVLVDEAQTFAPHYDAGDVSADVRKRSTAALADMMSRGRKRGVAGVIATQRIAETSKAVIAKATNIIVGRTIFDRDLERAGGLLGFTAGHAKALRTLSDGEFIAIGPAIAGPRRIRFKALAAETRHKGTAPVLAAPPAITAAAAADLLRQVPAGTIPAGYSHPAGVRGRGWDAAEDALIADGYGKGLPGRDIVDMLEAAGFRRRAVSGISSRAHQLGLASLRQAVAWSEEEDRIVAEEYRGEGRIMDISATLAGGGFHRSRQSIQMRAIHLGLTRDRVNYWSEAETKIAHDGLANGKSNREIIADLADAGFQRGVTSVSKFAQKHNVNRSAEPWRPEEIALLRELYAAKHPVREIADRIGKTIASVRARASNLGLKQRIGWTDAERQILINAHANGDRLVDAAARIGRPYPNVAAMAHKLQLDFRRPVGGAPKPPLATQGNDSAASNEWEASAAGTSDGPATPLPSAPVLSAQEFPSPRPANFRGAAVTGEEHSRPALRTGPTAEANGGLVSEPAECEPPAAQAPPSASLPLARPVSHPVPPGPASPRDPRRRA